MIISLKEGCTRYEVEHKLCNLLIPLYKAIGCLFVCMFVCPFFLSIKSKFSGQLLFGPLITKKIFFSTQPFPLRNRGAKLNFLGILNNSLTLQWIQLKKVNHQIYSIPMDGNSLEISDNLSFLQIYISLFNSVIINFEYNL